MPKWLQEMNAPTRLLWFYAIALGVATGASSVDEGLPNRADLASRLALSLVLALWVIRDAQKRGRQLCHDYGAAVFFLWPLVVPVYLFQTRGLRAFVTLACFAAISLIAICVGLMVSALRELGLF